MFDLSNVKENTYGVIPEGKYVAMCTGAEIKTTKSGTGEYIRAEFTIENADVGNRKLWTNFNVKNENQTAVEIGLSQLKTLLVKAGYKSPEKLASISDLCGLTVGVKTRNVDDRSEIHYFFDVKKEAPKKSEGIPF